MWLARHECEIPEETLEAARGELLSHARREGAHGWGFFPQLGHDGQDSYPCCARLAAALERTLVPSLGLGTALPLAFIRAVQGMERSEYGGLHLDVDQGILHARDARLAEGTEIVRVLVNLGDVPRTLEYVPLDIDDLAASGVVLSRESYAPLCMSARAQVRRVAIPPRARGALWTLTFVSSRILHAGAPSESGHFLAAYGIARGAQYQKTSSARPRRSSTAPAPSATHP